MISHIGEMRWREWGDGESSPERWTQVTAGENERDRLPVTLVAIDDTGRAAGAVALGNSDNALTETERADRSPWLLGLVVGSEYRGLGIGRYLVAATEDLAMAHSYHYIWVATGPHARDFYKHCGWTVEQELTLAKGGWPTSVLSKSL
ncbi:MAG: GNAT family N-acetyltransferase [Actinomycetota bacterium]|nr:GNAT family N-acetyltransferase [Actinomycetota bacterium]